MAITMLYCVRAKLQSSLKGSYSFFLINLTKLIVLAVLITPGFLQEYKWNSFMLHIICTILYNARTLHYADFFPLSVFLLRKWRDLSCHLTSPSRVSLRCFLKLYLNFPTTTRYLCNILKSQNSTRTAGFFSRAHIVEVPRFPFLVANIQTNRNTIVISWIGKACRLKCKDLNLNLLLGFISFKNESQHISNSNIIIL